jgi:amino-acid N-acetyltransferase
LKIRSARVGDVPAIYELIRTFADRKLMIRRSLGELYESIREFLVVIDDNNRVVGCAALHVFWEERAHGQGIGRKLVESCWDAARELELTTVFTLTYVPEFFEKCGYHRIDKHDLPHKIWNECVRCPLFPECHEVALVRSVSNEQPSFTLVSLAEVSV